MLDGLEIVSDDRGVTFWVHAAPGAGRSAVVGAHGEAVRIRVAAPPVDGKANAELLVFLAGVLGVPARAVELVNGATSRRKRLRVTGASAEQVRTRLVAAIGSGERRRR